MIQRAIVDTGPLVAFIDRRERHHEWVVEQFDSLTPPLLVCEPVLVETMFRLSHYPFYQLQIMKMAEQGALQLAFNLKEHLPEIRGLVDKYKDVPMSLADAFLVRMAEIHSRHRIFTLDSDFLIYRKHIDKQLALIFPEK
ncbi:MAG: PIN domain-containing protein [Nitrospirae bacterium]|nr:PIN domain-containing protein [Nitrospirota bacterium]